jgi:predicted nucleic acid-binding protein
VKAFLDTNVLVATFYGDHEHHERSLDLFAVQNRNSGCTATHNLAEVYSVLTGMPGKHRATPDEALLFLEDVRARLTVVGLETREHFRAVKALAASGVTGGGIYDGLLGYTAVKAKAQYIYTWNVKHFSRLGPEIFGRVRTP